MNASNMIIPNAFIQKWQKLIDLTPEILNVPAVLIMKKDQDFMEVVVACNGKDNPYAPGDKENWEGLYCETVIKTQKKLLITNALKDKNWSSNPDIKLGMISYLGYPINFPDKTPLGTICILDKKANEFNSISEKWLINFRDIIELDLALYETVGKETEKLNQTMTNQFNLILQKNKEISSLSNAVQKRIKELRGLFFLNNNSTANIQDFISVLTRDIIPRSMQFPKYVFSLVKLGSETISSCKNLLNSSTNYLSAPILCNEEYLGELRIGYTDTDMPFIPEFEQNLINSYADGLGRIVEINKAKEIIKGKDLKYKEFIELAPEAIMLGDNSKSIYILFANEKTCELTGYSIEELSTLTFQQLFTTDSLNKIPFRWGQIENGETVISQRDLTRKNGEIILVETISKKLPDNSFCTFLRDISHIKKAASIEFERNEYKLKAELKEAQNELYAEKLKVQEQEQELLNRQIQDQKKQMDYFNLLLKNKIKQNEDLLDVVRKVQEKGIVKECDNCVRIIEKRIREDKIHVDNAKANASLKDSYVSQLLEKYPALTKNDLRLISKIRLGIPNKQIAVLLNINTSSVIVGRYRLRQKLKLSKEQGLDAFLNSM